MHPSIVTVVLALCRRASLPASLVPAQLLYLLLRALAALWKRTAGELFAIAAGSAGELEACALALEKAVGNSPASELIGHRALFRLLGAHESGEEFLELTLAVRQTPGGHEVALIAAFDYQPPEQEGELFFAVLRSRPLTGVCEESDFDDAYGALLGPTFPQRTILAESVRRGDRGSFLKAFLLANSESDVWPPSPQGAAKPLASLCCCRAYLSVRVALFS